MGFIYPLVICYIAMEKMPFRVLIYLLISSSLCTKLPEGTWIYTAEDSYDLHLDTLDDSFLVGGFPTNEHLEAT